MGHNSAKENASHFLCSLKRVALATYGISIVVTAFCLLPLPLWFLLALNTITKSMAQIISVLVAVEIGQIFPVRVRSTMVGLGAFLMMAPLPLYPFLIELFSKESHYFITMVNIVMFVYGFLGAIFLPSGKDDSPKNKWEKMELEKSLAASQVSYFFLMMVNYGTV